MHSLSPDGRALIFFSLGAMDEPRAPCFCHFPRNSRSHLTNRDVGLSVSVSLSLVSVDSFGRRSLACMYERADYMYESRRFPCARCRASCHRSIAAAAVRLPRSSFLTRPILRCHFSYDANPLVANPWYVFRQTGRSTSSLQARRHVVSYT